MPKAQARALGKTAEKQAVSYLEAKGHAIHCRNYRFRRGEVDIIAQQGNLLLFIEVKGRTHVRYGFPEAFVTKQQQASYQEVATHYMEEKDWQGPIRFDIIALTAKQPDWDITHLQDAFY